MATPNGGDKETDLVRCDLCQSHVWVRKDRLEQHTGKVHSPKAAPRKSFTTYHARLLSTYPPKLYAQSNPSKQKDLPVGTKNNLFLVPGDIKLASRRGSRVGKGFCAECGVDELVLWRYSESNRGIVDICSRCKPAVFDRSFGKPEEDNLNILDQS